jgi:hypothetical protein
MIGFAALLYTGYWWPGILFVIAVSSIVRGLVEARGWCALQGAIWMLAFGVWVLLHYHIAVLFVAIGVSMIVGALVRPPMFTKKPVIDTSLE